MPPRVGFDQREVDTKMPRYTIDLSLEPEARYVALAQHYRPELHRLRPILDRLLSDYGVPKVICQTINWIARLLLRKAHSSVETAELRGISKAANIPMYLLLVLNLLLDVIVGCTSGAAKSRGEKEAQANTRMLHFRTMDWGMEALRAFVVQLDYVKTKAASGETILGSSITYVGFVGVLTGVRKGLSLSFNERCLHDASTTIEQLKYYHHKAMVLLGRRQSISSLLRSTLFGAQADWAEHPESLESLKNTMPLQKTTAGYMIFCDGRKCMVMEKDFVTAVTRESETFIVITNHDLEEHCSRHDTPTQTTRSERLQDEIEASEDRRNCMVSKWQEKLQIAQSKQAEALGNSEQPVVPTLAEIEQSMTVTRRELANWTVAYQTCNEQTHFVALLDPSTGKVAWSKRFPKPAFIFTEEEVVVVEEEEEEAALEA